MTEAANVSTPSPRVAELEAKRALVRDLLSGTEGMIAAGKRRLPQHPAESDGSYRVRLEGNTLTNFLAQAIEKANSRIFAKEITLTDIPSEIEPLLENIDLQGRDLNSFAMDVLQQAFADGVSYILVDKPLALDVKTKADEAASGIRPYAVHVQACCLLEVMAEMIAGVQTITRVRIKECSQVPNGEWGYVEQDRIRVLIRDAATGAIGFQLWEEQQKQDARGQTYTEWVKVDEGATGMKRIALVAVYTKRVGFMEGLPPFQATAELNLDHWRVKSEQKAALTMNCFEMLAATGVPDGWTAVVGPSKVQIATDPEAKFYYLSPSGAGVTLSAEYLKTIESQIDTASASLRVENGGNVTATAAALDSEEGCAGLKAVAEAAGDSLETMLSYFAEMMGLDPEKTGEVDVNSDFGAKKGSDVGLQELGKMRIAGDISRDSYIAELIRRGELAPDFDVAANDEEINQEGPSLASMTAKPAPVVKDPMMVKTPRSEGE